MFFYVMKYLFESEIFGVIVWSTGLVVLWSGVQGLRFDCLTFKECDFIVWILSPRTLVAMFYVRGVLKSEGFIIIVWSSKTVVSLFEVLRCWCHYLKSEVLVPCPKSGYFGFNVRIMSLKTLNWCVFTGLRVVLWVLVSE